MLLVASVFVWSGLTVCYGRSSEAIAHTVERQRDPVLRQKDVKAAEPGLPRAQRPLRTAAVLQPAGFAGASAGTIETVFIFRDRLTNATPPFRKRVRRFLEMPRGGRV